MIESRKNFVANQSELDVTNVFFLDESGVIPGMNRLYGWSPVGEQAVISRKTRGKRLSFVGAMSVKGPGALMTYSGTMNTERMLEFTKDHLVPILSDGSTVVMDGLNIHKNLEVKAMIEECGATVLILPPYSPELNPIEHLWSILKARIRAVGCLAWSELPGLVKEIWKNLPLDFYPNWVRNCGYAVPST